MRLTKGLYGTEFNPTSKLFDIRCGQMRGGCFVHNGGWYNQLGEKLGWGDLNESDLRRIASELQKDEAFIVLPEGASFWDFVNSYGPIGSMCSTKPDIEAPWY